MSVILTAPAAIIGDVFKNNQPPMIGGQEGEAYHSILHVK